MLALHLSLHGSTMKSSGSFKAACRCTGLVSGPHEAYLTIAKPWRKPSFVHFSQLNIVSCLLLCMKTVLLYMQYAILTLLLSGVTLLTTRTPMVALRLSLAMHADG